MPVAAPAPGVALDLVHNPRDPNAMGIDPEYYPAVDNQEIEVDNQAMDVVPPEVKGLPVVEARHDSRKSSRVRLNRFMQMECQCGWNCGSGFN